MNNNINLDVVWDNFEKRYRNKKIINLIISSVIIVAGIFAVIYVFRFDKEGVLTFRWLTVDSTIFTIVMTMLFVVINIVEIKHKTEMTRKSVYYVKLSSAVAEGLTIIVVLTSQLPVFSEHMHILRPDMFCMHILIPILTITSFVTNDSPIGRLKFGKLLHGLGFVALYSVNIVILIRTGVITKEQIPYFFLDFDNMSVTLLIIGFVFIYGVSFVLSMGLSTLNRKIYWSWFSNITGTKRRTLSNER